MILADGELSRAKSPPRRQKAFDRYLLRREVILDAATVLLNRHGLKGMTLLQVSQEIGLTTTSVTHYYRRKEDLAVAVFERTLGRLIAMVRIARREPEPADRVSTLLQLHLQLRAAVIARQAQPLAILSDIRTLPDDVRRPLTLLYRSLMDEMQGCLPPPQGRYGEERLIARANVLSEIIFWLPAWIGRYSPGDYKRIHARLVDILIHGLAKDRATAWTPAAAPLVRQDDDNAHSTFLRTATRLVNELGYRGASVDRIVADLQVTKGSFYHHHETKDDLVLECFRHSYRQFANLLRRSEAVSTTEWARVTTTVAALLSIQFGSDWPLLRTTALQVLPRDLRHEAVERSDRIALRLAGALSDCVAEGSIRAVDINVASQLLMAMLNVAYDLRDWAAPMPLSDAIEVYASTIVTGLLDDPAPASDAALDCDTRL